MYKASSIAGAFALTLVVAMGAASCGDDDNVVGVTEDAGGDAGAPVGDAGGAADAAGPTDAGGTDVVIESVQDPQIAQVLLTVNRRELDQGQIVKTFAVTEQVQQYAALMVSEYVTINARQVALFLVLGLVPTDSATSRQMQSESDAVVAKLEKLPLDFETVYINGQIAAHAEVIALIDRQLLPAARSAELKSELQTLREAVQAHLDAARTVQALRGISPQ